MVCARGVMMGLVRGGRGGQDSVVVMVVVLLAM